MVATHDINLDIMSFIEKNILPRYSEFGASHGLSHVQSVIKNSLDLARQLGADVDMAYVIAAYHDLGMAGPRAIHHITGGKILSADARLRKWFSNEQIRTMAEAVEDHRASSSHTPRSIYGKIVAEADRDLAPERIYKRAVQFGLEQYPEKDKEEMWKRFEHHLKEKYGRDGYLRLWIPNSPNEKYLQEIRRVIENPAELRKMFDLYYDEETGK